MITASYRLTSENNESNTWDLSVYPECTLYLAVSLTGMAAEREVRLDLRVSIMHRDETWTGVLRFIRVVMERLVFM